MKTIIIIPQMAGFYKVVLDMTREEIAGASKADGGMFAVIPAVVMRDSALSMSARMLYGIITWRCNADSRCWPTNRALGEDLGLSPKRISSLLSLLEAQGHIEVEIVCDPETGQIIRRYIYPIVKSGRGIHKNEDTSPREQGEGIPQNGEEKYKEEIKKENILAHLQNLQSILARIEVTENAREADVAVISALESNGYTCQSGVPVPSRGEDAKYSGRIGIVAAKDGVVIALETDRKKIRDKSLYKLRNYPCDIRLALLRGGDTTQPPAGIDAVIALRVKEADDLFHVFWDEYPKKMDKQRAYTAFKRLHVTPEMLGVMLQALSVQKRSRQWQEANGQYIPHASTWLNGRRWEDVPAQPQVQTPPPQRVVERDGVPVW